MVEKVANVDFEIWDKRIDVEALEKWHEWCKSMPYFTFPTDWQVCMLPAFGGAMLRFRVKKDDRIIDIYLDTFERLGAVKQPYWEALPLWDNSPSFTPRRYRLNEYAEMIADIKELYNGNTKKWL